MLQDKCGFIWAGTDFGLNRYDGYSMKKFYKNNRDTTSLSSNSITSLFEDISGKIWIGTMRGLNFFDPASGLISRCSLPPGENSMGIADIIPASDGNLLIAAANKTWIYNISTHVWKKMKIPLHAFTVGKFFYLPDQQPAIAASRGDSWWLLVPESAGREWKLVPVNSALPFARGLIRFYEQDSSGNQFLLSEKSGLLQVFDKAGNLQACYPDGNSRLPGGFIVSDIKETGDGQTWIATSGGLLVFDHIKRTISPAVLKTESADIPTNTQVTCILKDRSGDTWLGSFAEGMIHCSNRSSPFHHFFIPGQDGKKSGSMVLRIQAWPGGGVAAYAGNEIFLLDKGKLTGIKKKSALSWEELIWSTMGNQVSSLNGFQRKILADLYKFDPFFPNHFLLAGDSNILNFHETYNIYMHTPATRRSIFSGTEVFGFARTDSFYWVATQKGLIRFNRNTLEDTLYHFDPSGTNSLSESFLYSVVAEGDNLWMGTKGGGLNQLNLRENKFYHYTTDDGLPDNAIYAVVPDKKGNLWLSTNNGLSRFTIQSKTFINFSRRDGLLNSEFNRKGGLMTDDGYMYFGGITGIDYFKPEEIILDDSKPAVYFSQLLVNGKESNIVSANRFRFASNNLTVSFTANEFNRPDLVYFRYRLNRDDAWIRVKGSNNISLIALPQGHYRLELQASYNNLHWGSSAVYAFSILAPWWKSTWFYMLLIIMGALIFYFFYRYRMGQLKKMLAMRTRISKDLHDEVGATLSSIHIYSSVASKTLETDTGKSLAALDHIRENTKQVMENLNDIVWAVKAGRPDEYSLESKLKNYGYELLTPLNIHCEYRVDANAEKKLTSMEARRNILLIAKEAMNNIAKYSGATRAFVQLAAKGNNLELEISDNGKGMDPGNKRGGNGLFHMRERSRAMGGQLEIRSEPAKGTSVLCTIPMTSISDA